jgi:peptide-methionine (S)-S-oxide reductase
MASKSKNEIAIFAGGCFWHIQYAFSKVSGVVSTEAGYIGGDEKSFPSPTYEQVSSHRTGYAEAVKIEFNPKETSYEKLLEIFWKEHNPTTLNRQGLDIGTNYRSAIFYTNKKQLELAEKSKKEAQKSLRKPIVTEITKAGTFFRAEEYHQDYVKKHGGVDSCPII